ncbi:ATP-binding cassette domain-containing protein [Gracilibacillus salitolerans]|uniref:Carnitine transport ATP-binding protein OpuCA n=1 Tax=Gracilibacillus salitolerans TaxID=2663022 RepID=A0A5Q2TPM1_9BACI|nr:ABC transporter ATP-binding protein [Gracilibacillus salitolerans]QGH35993.1 ATP-binding cassette domain-containing protein [Gracilibacillus salitolerans]
MLICLKGIEKKYGNVQAVKPIDLTIEDTFVTILGQSGCGKTTLLKMLAGLTEPTAGDILFDDQTIFSKSKKINVKPNKRQIAMVFQDFGLWPHMTVFENVGFGLRGKVSKSERADIVHDALLKVKLDAKAAMKPGELSGGQQQRVALARAIAINPKLILFDEALSALDAILREQMREEILTIVQSIGAQAIFVTHDQTEAMAMSDSMIVMDTGDVVQTGSPEAIYHSPANPFVANFIGKTNWVEDKEKMIRPENVHLYPHKNTTFRLGVVKKSMYEGDRYVIFVETNGQLWKFYDHHPHEQGTKIKLYVEENNIHSLTKQEAIL